MAMAAVFFLLLLAFLSAPHLSLSPVSAWPDLPSMTVEALVAAKRALASFAGTAWAAGALLRGGNSSSMPGDERDAYAACEESYREATGTMDGVVAAVVECRFMDGDLGQVYRDGVAQVESCRDRVRDLPSSPLYARNLVDRNLAVLAYFLGRLLGVQ